MIRDLECDPASRAGPIDERVVDNLRRAYPLDDAFVAQMAACHGGVPSIANFKVDGTDRRIGRFLTLLDEKSSLTPPKRPHFVQPDFDERVMIGVPYLLEYEHMTLRALFEGVLPFAALRDDMCLDRADVDLVCLDVRDPESPAPVVLWDATTALTALIAWNNLPREQQFDEDGHFSSVPWDDFLIPLADSFVEFIDSLR